MNASFARMKIQVACAVKAAQSFVFVIDRMRMNNVHYNAQTQSMSRVNQLFQIFGRSEARTDGEKICNLITKRTIVWMFLNCHHLDCIVAGFGNFRQNIFLKFLKCRDLQFFRRHSCMNFVNQWIFGFWRRFVFPLILFGTPHLRRKYFCRFVLINSATVCRNPFAFAAAPLDKQFV